MTNDAERGVSSTSKLRIPGTTITNPLPVLNWALRRRGPLTSTGCDHGGFFVTPSAKDRRDALGPSKSTGPDLQMRFLAARAVSADGMSSFAEFKKNKNHKDGFSFQAIVARPHSTGSVLLASKDPSDAPVINCGYLSDSRDLATLREGLKMGRQLAKAKAFEGYGGKEVFPGPEVATDDQLDEYIKSSLHTSNALAGTCRMGADPTAVLDSHLRVKGVTGLRVADASVAPVIPGGQTGAMTYMVAERAAEFISNP